MKQKALFGLGQGGGREIRTTMTCAKGGGGTSQGNKRKGPGAHVPG